MIRLLICIFAHILSDFVFQGEETVRGRYSDNKKIWLDSNLYHLGIVFGTLFIIMAILYGPFTEVLLYVGIISILHICTDISKCFIDKKNKNKKCEQSINLVTFLLDQIIHLTIILIAWHLFDFKYSMISEKFIHFLENGNIDLIFKNINDINLKSLIINIIFLINILLYMCLGGSILIGKIFQIAFTVNEEDGILHNEIAATTESDSDFSPEISGKYIGMIERIIVMILVMNNSFTSIAFVFTAKSLARTKKLQQDTDEFSEKYLLGTLASVLIGILGGCIWNLFHVS